MVHGHIRHTTETFVKGKSGKADKAKAKTRNIPVKIDELLGDGEAQVERGRSIRMALPYGEMAVTSTCNIRVPCNSDAATILAVSRKAMGMIDEILEEDEEFMSKFLSEAKE